MNFILSKKMLHVFSYQVVGTSGNVGVAPWLHRKYLIVYKPPNRDVLEE